MLESDCETAFRLLQLKEKDQSELAYIIREAKDLISGDRELVVRKIHRTQNGVSHLLANRARSDSISDFWLEENCNLISQLVYEDISSE